MDDYCRAVNRTQERSNGAKASNQRISHTELLPPIIPAVPVQRKIHLLVGAKKQDSFITSRA